MRPEWFRVKVGREVESIDLPLSIGFFFGESGGESAACDACDDGRAELNENRYIRKAFSFPLIIFDTWTSS